MTPEGLELRERRYFATDEVLNYFKRHAKDWAKGAKLAPHSAEPKKQAPAPVPLQPIQQQWAPPPPQQQAWGAPPPQQGWGAPPQQRGWGAPPPQQQWGAQPPPRPMAGGPQGRGRGTTPPAWMTAQNRQSVLVSSPRKMCFSGRASSSCHRTRMPHPALAPLYGS